MIIIIVVLIITIMIIITTIITIVYFQFEGRCRDVHNCGLRQGQLDKVGRSTRQGLVSGNLSLSLYIHIYIYIHT